MKFIIFGEPISKARHRNSGRFHYDPQEKQKEATKKDLMVQVALYSNSENKSILGQINAISKASAFSVSIEFHFKPTKSDLWGLREASTVRSDNDNLEKFVLDCCNTILYDDDHKILALKSIKCYNPIPKTILIIEPMQIETPLNPNQTQVLKSFSPAEMKEFLDDVWMFTKYHSAEAEVMSNSEWQEWLSEVSILQVPFARKWGTKLHKLAGKIKEDE